MAANIGPKIAVDGEREYKAQIKNIIQETKTLDAQMKEVASRFDEESTAMSKNQEQAELLRQKKEALQKELELMQQKLDALRDSDEDTTTAEMKLEEQMAKVETQLNKTSSEYENVTGRIEDLNSPMGELQSLIETQETELENLRDQYANAWLSGDTQRCEELSAQINTLNGELSNNKDRMNEATGEAAGLTSALNETEGAEDGVQTAAGLMSSVFGGSISNMVSAIATGNLIGIIGQVVNVISDIADEMYDVQEQMDLTAEAVVQGTGAVGEALDDMKERAHDAWLAVANEDIEAADAGAVSANINTRLGLEGFQLEALTHSFLVFGETVGTDAAGAVNDLVDVMKQWGLVTGDSEKDMATISKLMYEFQTATQLADVSEQDLAGSLTSNAAAWQEMGYGLEDALGLMVQYRDAGGNASDVSNGMRTALQKLKEKTPDAAAALQEAISVMQSGAPISEVLSHNIMGTGVSIETAFGKGRAQSMINTFQQMQGSTESWTKKLKENKTAVEDTYAGMVTASDGVDYLMKNVKNEQPWIGAFTPLVEMGLKITGLYDDLGESMGEVAVESARNNQKIISSGGTMATGIEKSTGRAMTAVDSMKGTWISRVNDMKNNARVDFEVHGKLPQIGFQKLGSMINFAVQGFTNFAGAYDNAMILTQPTVFGMSGGNLLVGGDRAGAEVVVGEQHLMEMFTQAVQDAFGGGGTYNYGGATVNVYGAPGQDVRELAELVARQINRDVAIRR